MFQEQQESNGSVATAADRLSQELAALLNGAAASDMTALVDARTSFKGVIRFEGTVRIDGKVEGEVHTTGVLVVGAEAVLRARVSAGAIVSCGRIVGEVTATDKIVLCAPALLKGSVKTPVLSMEEGARLIGTTNMPEGDDGAPTRLGTPDEEELAKAG
jgi:cytoskeletal protein CcmA (bactofilin family)